MKPGFQNEEAMNEVRKELRPLLPKIAGVKSLHEFLEKGFKSFKKLGDVHDFIDPIVSREKELMQALFAANGQTENPLPEVVSLNSK